MCIVHLPYLKVYCTSPISHNMVVYLTYLSDTSGLSVISPGVVGYIFLLRQKLLRYLLHSWAVFHLFVIYRTVGYPSYHLSREGEFFPIFQEIVGYIFLYS